MAKLCCLVLLQDKLLCNCFSTCSVLNPVLAVCSIYLTKYSKKKKRKIYHYETIIHKPVKSEKSFRDMRIDGTSSEEAVRCWFLTENKDGPFLFLKVHCRSEIMQCNHHSQVKTSFSEMRSNTNI